MLKKKKYAILNLSLRSDAMVSQTIKDEESIMLNSSLQSDVEVSNSQRQNPYHTSLLCCDVMVNSN